MIHLVLLGLIERLATLETHKPGCPLNQELLSSQERTRGDHEGPGWGWIKSVIIANVMVPGTAPSISQISR